MRCDGIIARHNRRAFVKWLSLGLAVLFSSSPPSADAFLPTNVRDMVASRAVRPIALNLLGSGAADDRGTQNQEVISTASKRTTMSRPERKAMERQKKEEQLRSKKRTSSYSLHSNNISQLTKESLAEDVIRAIKRAQNNHDHQDLKVIADFLINECDVGFAYGYRGSLLARLAVAALHFGNNQVARRAIDIRRLEYRPSMLPMESAAIIRGLLRVHNATDALEILFDELSLPLEVSKNTIESCPRAAVVGMEPD
jgi:hypothetical protein